MDDTTPQYDQATLDKIALIKRQTNYGENDDHIIAEQLQKHGGDAIKVIKEHLGIPLQKKAEPIVSLNQAIYKQIREKMDITGNPYMNMKH